MTADFEKIIERRGTGCLKYDALQERFGDSGLIPLWVADMDFATPDFIMDALKERLKHPVLGYTILPDDYFSSIADWIKIHHGWNVEKEWIRYVPGVVKGIGMAINVFVKPDEKIIIQPPVYHPFRLVPMGNLRQVVQNPLIPTDNGYKMDFEGLEALADDKCRMLILSNPHNPGGVVWDCDTLIRLAEICHRKGIIVISDEIHCDLCLYGNRHITFASVSDEAKDISITFGAPTKTFNIAGVVSSYSIIPSDSLRRRMYLWMLANEFDEPNMFAPIATVAAYRKGEEWRRSLISYIEGNIDFLIDYCREYIPAIKPMRPSASYLVWLDCRELRLDQKSLVDLFINRAGLALNDGSMFGKEGEGFMRMNVACPRSVLRKSLDQLREAIGV